MSSLKEPRLPKRTDRWMKYGCKSSDQSFIIFLLFVLGRKFSSCIDPFTAQFFGSTAVAYESGKYEGTMNNLTFALILSSN